MNSIIIGIDPGANGAFAIRYQDGSSFAHRFTSDSDFLESMREIAEASDIDNAEVTVYIEQVGGFVGKAQPGSSMFNFGKNFGFQLGVCQAFSFRVELVRPQVWQKAYPTKTSKKENETQHKRELKDYAARLFPKEKVTLATADALLILDYATKKERGLACQKQERKQAY